jgi:predicted ArsR family transcriptional regulator
MLPRACNNVIGQVSAAIKSMGTATAYQLARGLNISARNVREYLHILHDSGEIHICGFGHYNVPIYRSGPGADAVPVSRAKKAVERSRKCRKRERAITDFWKQREKEAIESALSAADLFAKLSTRSILTATLFGVSDSGASDART